MDRFATDVRAEEFRQNKQPAVQRGLARALLARGAGGNPDADDPYEIAPAVRVFKERVKFSRGVLGDEDPVDEDALGGEADGKLWRGAGEDRTRPGGGAAKTWSTASFVNPSAWSFGSSGSQGTAREDDERSGERHRGEPHRDAAARDTEVAPSAVDDDRGAGSAGDPTDSSRRSFDSASPENLIKHHAAKKKLAKERDDEAARLRRTAPRDVRRRQSRGDIVVF